MNKKRTEIASLGQFGLIERLTAPIELHHTSTTVGVGDDAAVYTPTAEMQQVVSTRFRSWVM